MGNVELLRALNKIKSSADNKGVKFWLLGGLAHAFHAGELYREFGDIDLITEDEESCEIFCGIIEELGFEKVAEKNLAEGLIINVYRNEKEVSLDVAYYTGDFGLKRDDLEEDERDPDGILCRVVSRRFCIAYKKYWLTVRKKKEDILDLDILE